MRVFISWSGASERRVAEALKSALDVICNSQVEVFVSSVDINKGARGLPTIAASLDAADYGVVVVSAANQNAPWVNFEAGAMGRALDSRVATVLLDLQPADITGPLQQFQAASFADEADLRRLLNEIAGHANETSNPQTVTVLIDSVLDKLQQSWEPSASKSSGTPQRPVEEMVAEIVDRVRGIEKLLPAPATVPKSPNWTGRRPKIEHDLDVEIGIATGRAITVAGVFSTMGGEDHVVLIHQTETTQPSDETIAQLIVEKRIPGAAIEWGNPRKLRNEQQHTGK